MEKISKNLYATGLHTGLWRELDFVLGSRNLCACIWPGEVWAWKHQGCTHSWGAQGCLRGGIGLVALPGGGRAVGIAVCTHGPGRYL